MIYECKKCPGPKTFEEMSKDKFRPNGIKGICKKCETLRIKEYTLKNKEKIKARRLESKNNKVIPHNINPFEGKVAYMLKTQSLIIKLIQKIEDRLKTLENKPK